MASSCTLKTVYRIADNLIHRTLIASSQHLGGNVLDLYIPGTNIEDVRENLLLAGQKILPADIENVIDQSLSESASNLLVTSGLVPAELLPPGMDVIRQKLAAGGVQQARVGIIEDSVASIQKTYMEWTCKGEVRTANEKFQHLQALVRGNSSGPVKVAWRKSLIILGLDLDIA